MLLSALLAIGALVGATRLGGVGDPTVHGAYLLASVLLLPVGVLLARGAEGRLEPAPFAVALLALAVVIVRLEQTG